MGRTINAVYENGVLRPLESLEDISERSEVRLTVERVRPAGDGLAECAGTLPDKDAAETRRIAEAEFEQVDMYG